MKIVMFMTGIITTLTGVLMTMTAPTIGWVYFGGLATLIGIMIVFTAVIKEINQ